MNVKHLFSLAALTLVLAACGGGDDDPVDPTPEQEETPTITMDSSVTTNGLSFSCEAGENSITFTASDEWTLSVAATPNEVAWCTPSETIGGAGTVTVTFTVTANVTYDDRSVTVTIKCGTASKNFTVTQKAVEVFKLTVPEAGWLKDKDLSRYNSIKLIGNLNGDDIITIRNWARTERNLLDLSEAHIVSGGGAYYNDFYKTKDNEIGSGMFCLDYNNTQGCKFTRVLLPNDVTSIGDYAFYSCSNLASITIPNGVTFIGRDAFSRCSSLTSITIPSGVTSIGEGTFVFCRKLTSINIPSSVTSIGNNAFQDCSSLTSITIPSSMTSIGTSAFFHCGSLTSINIPSGVTSIGGGALSDCKNLSTIYSYVQEPYNVKSLVSSDNNITLYVPKGTKSKYVIAGGWNICKEIKEMED